MRFIFILFILFPGLFVSQIEIKETPKKEIIGTAKNSGFIVAEFQMSIWQNGDTIYVFKFHNEKYQILKEYEIITFTGEQTKEDFGKIMKSVFLPENKSNSDYKIRFNLGKANCMVSIDKVLGKTLLIFSTETGIVTLNEKHIQQLFGKE